MRGGFINGCFDILHVGHLLLFEFCKEHCDYLIVAVDSDEKVKKDKGASRPFNCLDDRIKMLSSLRTVDNVTSFDSKESLALLVKNISPDVMVVGSDWKGKTVVGSEYAKELRFFRRIDGYSTTSILENSADR